MKRFEEEDSKQRKVCSLNNFNTVAVREYTSCLADQ